MQIVCRIRTHICFSRKSLTVTLCWYVPFILVTIILFRRGDFSVLESYPSIKERWPIKAHVFNIGSNISHTNVLYQPAITYAFDIIL